MFDIIVHDNFLEDRDYQKLKNAFSLDSPYKAPWFYNDNIVDHERPDSPYNFQFTHVLYDNYREDPPVKSPYWKIIFPILYKLKAKTLIRSKVNLRTRTPEIYESGFHTDFNEVIEGHKTAIFYLNTNNGYTLFKSGEKIQSIANRILIFDARLYHCGGSCTNEKIRTLININYI